MKKIIFFIFMAILIAGNISAKETLAILPFTGGQGDEGETIAELFSFNDRLNDVFSPIPRTSIIQAIRSEQRFQMNSGMTDADTIAAIGHQLGARYVLAGNITSIGNNKLLVISIIDIRNLQQVAGDYQTYTNTADIRSKLPNMAANIIRATQRNTASLPKLAIVPVQLQGGVDQRVADTLTQILSIHIIRSGKYTVYPRTKSLEQVMEEHRIQSSGITADSNVVGIGYGENPNLVLSVIARRLDNIFMFNAAIINLSTGEQVIGRSVDYRDINDGIRAMERLSIDLTSTAEEISQRQIKLDREAHWNEIKKYAKRNFAFFNLGLMGGFEASIQWGDNLIGFSTEFAGIQHSFIPFTSFGLSGILTITTTEDEDNLIGVSGLLNAGFVIPLNKNISLFGDGLLNIGSLHPAGLIANGYITPGFDIGFSFVWVERPHFEYPFFYPGLEIKYKGLWHENNYVNSLGITMKIFLW